jgi:hypothetical protein
MRIYIATSSQSKHALDMLTTMILQKGHEVFSIADRMLPGEQVVESPTTFEKWVDTENANHSFEVHTRSAMSADLVIYISPSGKDAAAECGMAFRKSNPHFWIV